MERQFAELVDTFENHSLAWLRAADYFDISESKISRLVKQAYAIEKLLEDVEDYQTRHYVDQVFLALIDNPRLIKVDLVRYISLIYQKRRAAKRARKYYRHRQKMWTTLSKFPTKEDSIRNFICSRVGNFEGCNSLQRLKCAILKTNISMMKSDTEKIEAIRNLMADDHFKEKDSLKILLEIVRDHDSDLLTRL